MRLLYFIHPDTENKTLLIQARDHFTRTLALDQDNTIAKTFIEEVGKDI